MKNFCKKFWRIKKRLYICIVKRKQPADKA